MPLTTPKTQLQLDLDMKDISVLRVAEALNHAAATLKRENDLFWSLPTDRLLAVLNADVALTLATFGANTAVGTPINAILDQLGDPRFSSRAPTDTGRTDIVFNGTQFVQVLPEAPVEEPPVETPES